ncbi:MAG TPA: flagellar basal body P-ring formation protein FlgA [Gammaproteobacteria bacterium]|nr:flagellar basal body P-ring formation protein FlgA [Gammaproteobacteria bacterium]
MQKKISLVILLFLLNSITVQANARYQSHAQINSAVQTYLDTHIKAAQDVKIKTQISRIDSRLKLSACDQPLKTFVNNRNDFSQRVSVGVKCEGHKPWSLYVPVKIQRFAKVYVAAQPIAKGEQITPADIQQVSQDVSTLRGRYYKTKQEIMGKIAKRSIRLGAVFNPRYLGLPIVVKKGDKVDIVAETQGIRIRMAGKAINAGAKGQQISVKNLSSKRIIQAIVQNPGLVKVMM